MTKILFSPVGSTDPITRQNDGAMLHIIRKYRPDKVYLYMSGEICEIEDRDHRYSWCLARLKEHLDIDFDVEYIRREELTEVHIFDYFLEEFRTILTQIYDPNAEMLLNVSSGTPAMKSALQILSAMYDRPMKPIQVHTPEKRMNARGDARADYDVELEWELNIDNREDYVDRCTESSVVNMIVESKVNVIKRMIEAYDYVAAYKIAEPISDYLDSRVVDLIRAGDARLKLDKSTCSRLCSGAGYDMYPVKRGDHWGAFEFLMVMRIKLLREEYADYIRCVSPLFSLMMEKLIEGSNEINLDDYCSTFRQGRGTVRKWDKQKTEQNPLFDDINGMQTYDAVISSDQYCRLINKLGFSGDIKDTVNRMRDVEKDIRNTAAHTVTFITDEVIKNATGMKSVEIFNLMKKLVKAAGISMPAGAFDTYDSLNEEIKKYLDAAQ